MVAEIYGQIQSEDSKSAFHFFAYFNGLLSEWVGYSATDVYSVENCDFVSLFGCTQLVRGSTHSAGGILDLVMPYVPDL